MTVIFWPRREEEPLPNTAGLLVGWRYGKDTLICAKILHHGDHALVQRIQRNKQNGSHELEVFGKWDPISLSKSWPSVDDLPLYGPTPLGPWQVDRPKGEDDLLVYYEPVIDLELSGTQLSFSPIVKRLGQVDSILAKLANEKVEEDVETGAIAAVQEPAQQPLDSLGKIGFLQQYSLFFKTLCGAPLHHRIPLIQLLTKDSPASTADPCMTIIDAILGLVICFLIFHFVSNLERLLGAALNSGQQLRTAILWLESFPAGFKLNVPLTRNMGRELLNVLDYWHTHVISLVLGSSFQRTVLLQVFSVTSFTFGLSTMLALVVDTIQLLGLHLTAMYVSFAKIHQCQLYLLSSLWKLFRGKKHNPLRQRTDTMEYDSTQLLLGMLLFTFVLFLFTTILVYYLFFTTIAMAFQPLGPWLLYGVLRDFPLTKLWRRVRHPTAGGIGFYLEPLGSSTTTTRLRVIPKPYTQVLSDFTRKYPGRIFHVTMSSLGKLMMGQSIELLRDCFATD